MNPMTNPPKSTGAITVSVILATYNRAHYLPEALDSLLHQTRRPDEIIVVDDGSTDNTAEVIGRYAQHLRYFKNDNHGKSSALNFGMPLAQGSHIWIFDDDDVALPDALQSHVDFLGLHPEADFSYSTNYLYPGNGDIWQRDKWRSKIIPDWSRGEFLIRIMEGMPALLLGMMIPKRCFEEAGPFDETLLRAQDHEMLIRLAARFRALNILKPTFVLRDHRSPQFHSARQRAVRQFQYQQRIFRSVRDKYPLAFYLPHEPGSDLPVLTETERGLALLQRSCIMFRQGLYDEGLDDLRCFLHLMPKSALGTLQTYSLLSKAFDIELWIIPHPYRFILLLSRTLRQFNADFLSFAIARGIYWAFKRSLHKRPWRNALRSATMLGLMVLCNTRGVSRGRQHIRHSSSR